jgi:phytoene dehydrogenase-like protein
MDTNFYDVIVCGAELAGVVAAALLGRRGLRVLLLGHDLQRPTFEAGGFVLSRGPALLPPLDSPALARVLKELSLVQVVRRRAQPVTGGFQVALPRHRFDVPPDAAVLRRELDREWPLDRAIIEDAIGRLGKISALLDPLLSTEMTIPADGFWERREMARFESQLPRPGLDPLAPLEASHPFRSVAGAVGALGTGFGPGDIGAVTLARAFAEARQGPFRVDGAEGALWTLFLDKIETFAGDRREKVLPVEIVQQRGKAVGLRVRPRDETIGCKTLVWAGPAATALPLLGESPTRRAREAAQALRPVCYRYGLSLLVKPQALPEGMGPRVLAIADPRRAPLEENALSVTVGIATAREPDRVPVWVECLVPAAAVEAGPGHLAALRGRVREHLGRLLPFFDQHLVVLASPYDGLPAEVPGGAGPGKPMPVTPQPMAPVYSSEQVRSFDPAGIGHGALGIKNLYVLGRENLPGLGVEGDFVSAWGLARLLTTSRPRRDVLRRRILVGEG